MSSYWPKETKGRVLKVGELWGYSFERHWSDVLVDSSHWRGCESLRV